MLNLALIFDKNTETITIADWEWYLNRTFNSENSDVNNLNNALIKASDDLGRRVEANFVVMIPALPEKATNFGTVDGQSLDLSKNEDAKGRRLSKISPLFFDSLHDNLFESYTNHTTKKIRFVYYDTQNESIKKSTAKIVFYMEKLFIIVTDAYGTISNSEGMIDITLDENQNNIMENLSQTGSYYKINGRYTWSQGI